MIAIFAVSNNTKKAPWEKQKNLAKLELQAYLLNQAHPAVWKEMQRKFESIPVLKKLFEQVPEALLWA